MSDSYNHALAESILRHYYALRNDGKNPTAIKLHPGELKAIRKFLEFENMLEVLPGEDRILGMRIIQTTETLEPNQRLVVE